MKFSHDTASSIKKEGISKLTVLILLLIMLYAGLTLYSGTFLPLRLIKGTSMEPTLSAGDIVLLKKVPFSSVEVGDVIAYTTPEQARTSAGTPRAILHRVIESRSAASGRVLTTKGDNSDIDPWRVVIDDFHGVQVMRIPLIAKPLVFLTSPRGILFLSIGTLITLLYFPAMMIFHMVVIKKPDSAADNGSRNDGSASSATAILGEVEQLKSEQERVSGSLLQLSESISYYAVNLQSHTEVVQDLASVTGMLKSAVKEGALSGSRPALTTVMIVDDQEPFRNRARNVVELEGEFRVVAEASDGTEAVELMEKVSPDLIVMDVQMPQMNGFEAARRIHEQHPHTPIAIVSMDGEQQYVDMAEEVGARAFIHKKDLNASSLKQIIQMSEEDEA